MSKPATAPSTSSEKTLRRRLVSVRQTAPGSCRYMDVVYFGRRKCSASQLFAFVTSVESLRFRLDDCEVIQVVLGKPIPIMVGRKKQSASLPQRKGKGRYPKLVEPTSMCTEC